MDPVEYYALLKLVDAPGIVSCGGPSCQYVQTPIRAPANSSTPSWSCPAGKFCLSPKHSAQCPPGFYCPPNTAQPMYCCPGYYCSSDTKSITLCPQNHYCPAGSVGGGLGCLWLASCPAGSSSASKFGLILFVLILLFLIWVAFWIHHRIEQVRAHHLEKRLRWIHNHNTMHENPLLEDDGDETDDQDSESDDDDDGEEVEEDKADEKTVHSSASYKSPGPEMALQEAPSSSAFPASSASSLTTPSLLTSEMTVGGEWAIVNMEPGDIAAAAASLKQSKNKKKNRGTKNKNIRKVAQTFEIEFEHLGLTLSNGTSILQNVSGVLRSGRTCAIMGPSGSGKTTLLNLLTSKTLKDTGSIRVNGLQQDLGHHFRKLIGFVPQEDVMIRELTVHDILLHSAYMRLPSDLSRTQMTERVLEMVDFLGLNSVMDSVVGDAEERGISGGQRKRVNIGMELVADPSILFLDEPTSGLDSSTSADVCRLLRAAARRKGLTVAAVIHSPSPAAFDQFDDLLLLGHGGRVVFHGPCQEAPAYFAAIGFQVPPGASPSDHYMDVISNNVKSRITTKFKPFYLSRYWESYCRRAQTFYALGSRSGVEYRHPTGASRPSSPQLQGRTSGLLSYPSLNQSMMDIHHHSHGISDSLAMTSLSPSGSSNNISSVALSSTTSPSTSTSALTLHPPPSTHSSKHHRHSRHKSVTLSPASLSPPSSNPSSPRPSMALSDYNFSVYSSPPPPEDLTFSETLQKSIRIFMIDSRMWWKGVLSETLETLQGLFLSRKDPVRNTANPFMMFWLCLNRARLQIYSRSQRRQFLYDQILHLGCGLFISIAASRFDYLGRQPDLVCAMTPFQLQGACTQPVDHLTEVGVFIALGVCFAGISVGTGTFGREKIVYWREKSSGGLLTLPYYLAKVVADIPRIILAGVMFSLSLMVFFKQRADYGSLVLILTALYAVAFSMGYVLSAWVPQNRVALAGTGFTLAWAIVFSGDAPDLAEVMDGENYKESRWLWIISAPRYAIEAIYLRELDARPWSEIREKPLSHSYELGEFWWCVQALAAILLGWHVLAFFSFKLKDRNKQR